MKRAAVVLIFLGAVFLSFFIGFWVKNLNLPKNTISNKKSEVFAKPYEVYYLDRIADKVSAGNFRVKEILSEKDKYSSSLFEFKFKPNPEKAETKITTGVINTPIGIKSAPIIFLIRGYVDQELYTSGMGTKRVAEYFAENGFITVAPDFLGYGGSDSESENIFETRFQTYVTMIALQKSIGQIPGWDGKNVFIWAHSNGGQIALSWIVSQNLEYPTVLWAPVTKPFPYSILYYTDESDDSGKLIRTELAKLENIYDLDKFSYTSLFDRIKNPIQLHQGIADDAVPLAWSNSFINKLKKQNDSVEYFTYPSDDHNLSRSWGLAIKRNIDFYNGF
ncbi:MAG: Peptidase [Microgenomates group bacterium GW2011_GWC1_37_12b]|nr:MAG: Peptidase [Microgenomates group bacterium GW2011_GWC1_37_12b]